MKHLFSPNEGFNLQSGPLADQIAIGYDDGPVYYTVRALSWKQPYASLMLHGKIETRTWDTKYRGLVLICASKQPYNNQQIVNISGPENYAKISLHNLEDNPNCKNDFYRDEHLLGVAIAIGELVDCRPMRPEDVDACFVEYNPDLYCHVYANVRAIEPFEWKGKQGWATLTNEQIERIIIK